MYLYSCFFLKSSFFPLSLQMAKDQARWDTNNHKIFIDVCLQEVAHGNRRGMTFNSEGRKNCVANFRKLAGRDYDWGQLKNHWDNLKSDWITWNAFTKDGMTGIGWDSDRGTFDASAEWWDRKIEVSNHFMYCILYCSV